MSLKFAALVIGATLSFVCSISTLATQTSNEADKVEPKKQINSIIDLAHGFTFYADGRFPNQYMPKQRWARNLASFKHLDIENANANMFVIFEADHRIGYTEDDFQRMTTFVNNGGLLFITSSKTDKLTAMCDSYFGFSMKNIPNQKALELTPHAQKFLTSPVEKIESRGAPGAVVFKNAKDFRVYLQDADKNPVVVAKSMGKGNILFVPRCLVSQHPDHKDANMNASWISPIININVVKKVETNKGPIGKNYTEQDYTIEVDGITFYYSEYLKHCYEAMNEIITKARPLIEKRMGVPLSGKNASGIALLATSGGGFSAGQLVALAVFWENFPEYRPGMYEFLTHELTHSWVLPFPEIWNEPIATYVGDLVMCDAGYEAEGRKRIQQNINDALRQDPEMNLYDLDGNPIKAGTPPCKDKRGIHWGKTFFIFEELAKENPTVLADYFKAKRQYATPDKIKKYGLNETIVVMSIAMKKDMFSWFEKYGMKGDATQSQIPMPKFSK